MALTNAEKQKLYRTRHYCLDPEIPVGTHPILHRLQTNLDSQAFRNLERLAKVTGMTKREIIEKAINDLAERLDCKDSDFED